MAGKKLKSAKAQVDRLRLYQPLDAVRLLKSFETAKFDEAVEAHFRLGLNVRAVGESPAAADAMGICPPLRPDAAS